MSFSLDDVREWVKKEANFFRVHLLFFLVVPLVSAAIFYAANGQYPVGEFCQRWTLSTWLSGTHCCGHDSGRIEYWMCPWELYSGPGDHSSHANYIFILQHSCHAYHEVCILRR